MASVVGQRVERAFREQAPAMWRAVFLFTGDREIASDAVAEAFAQALRRGSEVRSVEKWVWRTAFLIARGMLKDQSKVVGAPPSESHELPGETVELLDVLRGLSSSQRAAVVLRYFGDFSVRQVAFFLGTTPAAVSVHLYRARKRLRDLLEVTDV